MKSIEPEADQDDLTVKIVPRTLRFTEDQDKLILRACMLAGVKPAPKARELIIEWARKTMAAS